MRRRQKNISMFEQKYVFYHKTKLIEPIELKNVNHLIEANSQVCGYSSKENSKHCV
jgi:hypothetical protein